MASRRVLPFVLLLLLPRRAGPGEAKRLQARCLTPSTRLLQIARSGLALTQS